MDGKRSEATPSCVKFLGAVRIQRLPTITILTAMPFQDQGGNRTTMVEISPAEAQRTTAVLDQLRYYGVNVQHRTLGSEAGQVRLEITTGPPGETNPDVRRDGRIAIPTSDSAERQRICDEVISLSSKGAQLNCLLRDDIVYVGTGPV